MFVIAYIGNQQSIKKKFAEIKKPSIYLSIMFIEHTYNSRFVQNRFKSVISNL